MLGKDLSTAQPVWISDSTRQYEMGPLDDVTEMELAQVRIAIGR